MANSAPFPVISRLAVVLAVLLLPGCVLRPYTLDIQQGVVVEQDMLTKLKPGMTRNQVGLTMGTPLLADPMHADRWDYVYYTRVRGEVGEWRRLTLTFKGDQLATITGDVTVAPGAPDRPAAPAPGVAPEPAPGTGVPVPLPDATGPGPKS